MHIEIKDICILGVSYPAYPVKVYAPAHNNSNAYHRVSKAKEQAANEALDPASARNRMLYLEAYGIKNNDNLRILRELMQNIEYEPPSEPLQTKGIGDTDPIGLDVPH